MILYKNNLFLQYFICDHNIYIYIFIQFLAPRLRNFLNSTACYSKLDFNKYQLFVKNVYRLLNFIDFCFIFRNLFFLLIYFLL